MGKLANIARNTLGTDGEYISLDNITKQYPEGVTINGAFIREYKVKVKDEQTGEEITQITETPCFTFVEDSNKYFYAVSGDVARLFENWFNNCNKDINELTEMKIINPYYKKYWAVLQFINNDAKSYQELLQIAHGKQKKLSTSLTAEPFAFIINLRLKNHNRQI